MRAGYVPVKKLFNHHRFPGEVMLPEGRGSWAGWSSLRSLPAWIILWYTSHPSESPDIFKTSWEFLSLECFGHEEIIQLSWLNLLMALLHKLFLLHWTWRREMLKFSFFSCLGLCPSLPSFPQCLSRLTRHRERREEFLTGQILKGKEKLLLEEQSAPASCGRQRCPRGWTTWWEEIPEGDRRSQGWNLLPLAMIQRNLSNIYKCTLLA